MFTVVETDWTEEFYTKYNQIKEDYQNGMKVKDIKAKYNLTDGSWQSYRKELINDGFIELKRNCREPKYYTLHQGRFCVQKVINKRKYHIASFKTEKEAQKCVELMKQCNWNMEKRKEIVDKVRN